MILAHFRVFLSFLGIQSLIRYCSLMNFKNICPIAVKDVFGIFNGDYVEYGIVCNFYFINFDDP